MLIECFVDGASRGQGRPDTKGDAAIGVVICKNKKPIAELARGLGKRTNNEAEYEAVITALLMCAMADYLNPIIYSDSLLVVNQINEKWECNTPDLWPLLLTVKIIQETFNFKLVHVNRKYVAVADFKANEFLDLLAEKDTNIKQKRKPR